MEGLVDRAAPTMRYAASRRAVAERIAQHQRIDNPNSLFRVK
jgi:hypothetical protein